MSETATRINNPKDPQINVEYLSEMYQNELLEEKKIDSLFGYMKKQY